MKKRGRPYGPYMSCRWGCGAMLTAETWYVGSEGAVYCRHDMGPVWWITTDTPELAPVVREKRKDTNGR
jgi:hypothetical protein